MFKKTIIRILSAVMIFGAAYMIGGMMTGDLVIGGQMNEGQLTWGLNIGQEAYAYSGMYNPAPQENAKYTGSVYFDRLSNVRLTGNFRNDVMAVAYSQMGYHEGNNATQYDGSNTKGSRDYTEFGRYFGSVGNAWCSEFASWCNSVAGVPMSVVGRSKGANAVQFTKGSSARYYKGSKCDWTGDGGAAYIPQRGDIILWVWPDFKKSVGPGVSLSHTAILETRESNGDGTVNISVVHGNAGGKVGTAKYRLNAKGQRVDSSGNVSNKGYVGYIVAPDYEKASVKRYVLTFAAGGGSIGVSNNGVSNKGSAKSANRVAAPGGVYGVLPLAAWKGHMFMGWYTTLKTGGSRVCMYTTSGIAKNQTLYARWESTKLARPKIKSVKGKKKALTVKWKKAAGVKGYQLQYSRKKNFKKAKTITIKKAKKTKRTIRKLKRKKRYYVRIRTYKVVGGKTFYSAWSKKKSRKTK